MTAVKSEASVQRGFGALPCPKCGAEATVALDLDCLTGEEACRCAECEETFGLGDVRAVIARSQRVLAWLEQAPALEE